MPMQCGAGALCRAGLTRIERAETTQWSRFVRYLVDPASSDMLVLKIKPCMYQYKPN